MQRTPLVALLLAFVLVLPLAACNSTADETEDLPPDTETGEQRVPTETGDTDVSDAPNQPSSGVTVAGDLGTAPTITLPDAAPPSELIIEDIVVGDGAEVPAGAEVTIHYAGVSWLNGGVEFDSSWSRGTAATFPLAQLIPGWQQGIPGMKVGGRRLLVIPPELGYGDVSPTPAIASGDTLVFVIDLEGVG